MSQDERQEVLDLLAKGKITVEEAAALLAQAKMPPPEPPPAINPDDAIKIIEVEETAGTKAAASGQKPAWFRIRVSNLETGKNKVSVNIPVRMLKFGFTVANHFAAGRKVDLHELESMLATEEGSVLVDVQDEENSEHIQIYLE